MNKTLLCTSFALIAFGATNCLAESDIPNLAGKWTGEKEFAKILKTESPIGRSHTPHEEFGKINVIVEFTMQEGRLLKGTKTSEKWSEQLVCAIDYDNRGLYCTDENGMFDGQLVGTDAIIFHYHHVASDNSVVSIMKLTKRE
jgi:hypothetical protein